MESCLNVLCILICLLIVQSRSAEIYSDVSETGKSGNPGLKMRITQNGLNYVNDILRYEMNRIIPRMRLKDTQYSEGRGTLTVTNGRVTNYKQPRSQSLTLQPPDKILWKSSGSDITLNGHVQGNYGRFSDDGDVDVFAKDVDFVLSIHPLRQSNGQFGVKVESCDAKIGSLDYNIYNSGALGRFLENSKGQVTNRMKPRIEDRICQQATKIIDQAGNEQLASMPTKVPLNETAERMFNQDDNSDEDNGRKKHGGKSKKKDSDNFFADEADNGDRSSSIQRDLAKNVTKHMTFDYSNLKDPSVQARYMETYNKGEISYHGQGGTPFYPPNSHEPGTPPSNRMAYIIATDYVANSMLYNAFTHDLLKSRISGNDTPDFKSYLKTTCDGNALFDLCLGTLIPEMQESFPNSKAEFEIQAIEKAPAVIFRQDGSIDVISKVLVNLLAEKNGQHRLVAVATVDTAAKAKLFIDDNKIKGECTIDKYNMTIKENHLKKFDEEREKEFAASSKAFIQTIMNMYLRNGLRIPTRKTMKLKDPKLNVYERTVRIDTDLEADKEELTKKAIRVIRKNGGNID